MADARPHAAATATAAEAKLGIRAGFDIVQGVLVVTDALTLGEYSLGPRG